MNRHAVATPSWSTASFGDTPDTSPMELSELGDHLGRCKKSRGRMFSLQCAAETMHGFVSSRVVTTLVVAALILGGVLLAI